jgi:hypothetical protein
MFKKTKTMEALVPKDFAQLKVESNKTSSYSTDTRFLSKRHLAQSIMAAQTQIN